MKKVLLVGLLCSALAVQAHALVDISSKVQVVKGAPTFNYVTNQTSVSLSIKNISNQNLQIPVRVVLSSITPAGVACANPDGVDSDGKSFFLLTLGAATGIKPGETSSAKPILFSNPNRLRFNFMTKAYISTPENTMNDFISGLDLINPDLVLKEFDDHAREVYGQILMSNTFEWPTLANMMKNKLYIPITDVMGKYEIRVSNAGTEEVFLIYMYKNSKGEWKIFML